ncbi:MAG: GNAT family N-acetyltransferase [Clostridia bacterium]|nr:GNAT family N-acetyltransferase [Clostridia bacterium]
MKKLQIVPLSKMEEMRKYFYDYMLELSQFDPDIEFDEKGAPIYNWLDCYWNDKERYPLFFLIDGNIAGFAMIRELENMLYEIAEFYVCPPFRKDGNAIWFATEITKLFEGQFIFSTRLTNPRAIKFWDKFVKLFDSNQYIDDENCRNWTIRKNSFKVHSLNLAPIYFDLINSGEKTLEGRLNDEKRKEFNIGDKITFYKEPEKTETMKAIILNKYIFNNFDEMANTLDKKELGFQTKTKQEMVDVYRTIYTKEDEQKHGVVIFKIKLIK